MICDLFCCVTKRLTTKSSNFVVGYSVSTADIILTLFSESQKKRKFYLPNIFTQSEKKDFKLANQSTCKGEGA